MQKIKVYHYDAFTTVPNKGNPAGIVFEAEDLTDQQMVEIARKVGFNETSFVLESEVGDYRIRFFTPGHEMNLCGHATIATWYALKTRGFLHGNGSSAEFSQETKAGTLPIRIETSADETTLVWMKQTPAEFIPFEGSLDHLAQSIGLTMDDLDLSLPVVYGSTGIWTLLVPIRKLDAFKKMVPDNQRFPSLLNEMPRASVHPFCLETFDPTADMHGRHFSSPFSVTVEDAVTGTASGVMGAYYAKYIKRDEFQQQLIVEQGQEIGREGRVQVHVTRPGDQFHVEIAGTAVYVKEFEVEIQ
ncbi:PhzF family phenazine biosynthesis protein [Effusibacillus consociatus]|uniref:PhzF family phenazine biosynthesis protein n=1 Tax=Effusibacillus consociatus TaxID=1117041 RepID=A0ABV9Q7J6_9BACL